MPTWTELEMAFLNTDKNSWYDNFVSFGGVPRYVMPNEIPGFKLKNDIKLKSAIATKGMIIAEEFFKDSFGTIDLFQNYMLVHINPPLSTDGDFQYEGAIVYSFASDYIFQKLVEKNKTKMLTGAAGMFNVGAASDEYGAVSAGNLFEKICLWLNPLTDKQLEVFSFEDANMSAINLSVPSETFELPHDWKKTQDLPANKFILPRISNLQSGDAFFVEKSGRNYRMVIFQITVGKSHPVKANGLNDIFSAFPKKIRDMINEMALIFVIPNYGTLNRKQQITTKKGTEFKKAFPSSLNNLKQYVYKYKI
jgi:hypothetical protein